MRIGSRSKDIRVRRIFETVRRECIGDFVIWKMSWSLLL